MLCWAPSSATCCSGVARADAWGVVAQRTSGGSATATCAAKWASTAWPWTRSARTSSSPAARTRSVRAADLTRNVREQVCPAPLHLSRHPAETICDIAVPEKRAPLTKGPAHLIRDHVLVVCPILSGRCLLEAQKGLMSRTTSCPCTVVGCAGHGC